MEEKGSDTSLLGLEQRLPSTIIATILSKLDLRSLCAASASCRSLHLCATHALSFVPSFNLIEISPSLDLLRPLLPYNPYLRSLKLDCRRLNDSSIGCLTRASLHEICLHNCENISGRLLFELGRNCSDLRSVSLRSLAEHKRLSVHYYQLKEFLIRCSHLESLSLLFDISKCYHPEFPQAWEVMSNKLTSLEIGYISMRMLTTLLYAMETQKLSIDVSPSSFPRLQKLRLSVDYITDELIASLSNGLPSLTHLDLLDAPGVEPLQSSDLTNLGLQCINKHGIMKHISLVRSQQYLLSYFRWVNDLGFLLMCDSCPLLESIKLGGFCRVTDTGFRAIIHSCPSLREFRVTNGIHLTDLVFHDMSATSLSLTHVSLRRCHLLTSIGIARLSFNAGLTILNLRDCRNIGDEAVRALGRLRKLHTLFLDGTDISDIGVMYLGLGSCPLVSLSLRGCRKLTDSCISSLFGGSAGRNIRSFDLSRIPNLSDDGILMLARTRTPIVELRIRECPQIGDTSVMALASMQVEGGSFGSSLRLLDIYDCGRLTPLAFSWFKKPYFPRLRWLGVRNWDKSDVLAGSRPFLQVACCGEELGNGHSDLSFGWYHKEDELDVLKLWLLEDDYYDTDEEGDIMLD